MSVSITRAYVPVEVDLWGVKYETVSVPRSGQRKALKLEEELGLLREGVAPEGMGDLTPDEVLDKIVDIVAALMDVKLTAVEGKSKPSTAIRKHWKADELTFAQLMGTLDEIKTKEGEGNRPT